MRVLIQRVQQASVSVAGEQISSINKGLLIFLGTGKEDTQAQADTLWNKISKLRIFEDEEGKTNLSLQEVQAECLIVSQFTLYASCKKGNRPSFTQAQAPNEARELYEYFIKLAKRNISCVQTGEFGALMQVELINDGPFTLWLDSEAL